MPHFLIAVAVVISAVTGLITKYILDRIQSPYEITWKEYGIVMAIISLLAAPGSAKLGWELAKSNKIAYHEYWNGWEMKAVARPIKCERDGSCQHDYDCDPYEVQVSYSCNCDNKGNCDTCWRSETHYHSCPYVDVETDYVVETTLGDYLIAGNRFPMDPQNHRWRRSERIPESVIERAGVGPHPFWLAAKNRLEKGNPGPVTKRMDYENYIYASERTILKQYSGEIKKYLDASLLPPVQSSIHHFFNADKVYFVGFRPKNTGEWQRKLSYFNAALGMELQGDLHLVIVQNDFISKNPDEYAIALKAYWQNIQRFGKDAFSKNAVAVLIGTENGEAVSWARAFTGMPMGNEELITTVTSRLKGSRLDLEEIVGNVRGKFSSKGIVGEHGNGVLEDIVFGLSDPSTRFGRISMSAKHKNDKGGGFLYLMTEIRPTVKQQALIIFLAFAFCSVGWVAAVFIGQRTYKRRWR